MVRLGKGKGERQKGKQRIASRDEMEKRTKGEAEKEEKK